MIARFALPAIVPVFALLTLTAPLAARADDIPQIVTCADFSGPTWINPYPPNDSHTRYRLSYAGAGLSCGVVLGYAKKLLTTKLSGPNQGVQAPVTLPGGPAGYACTSSIDNTGHAYQGSCRKTTGGVSAPLFSWGGSEK